MQIGLIAVDGRGGFPNLALMRLSTWHKRQGDAVDWWNGFECYDRVYMSKVFTFTPDFDTVINADEIVAGGTGYKDYCNLPEEIEASPPDYTLYPQWKPAIGFLTRGCSRHCGWCIVPRKEGAIHPAAIWEEIKRPDSRKMILLDNGNFMCYEKEEAMRKVTVSVQVDAEKLRAIQFYAGRKDSTVEAELEGCVEKLYEKYVPAPTREYIESMAATARPARPSRSASPSPSGTVPEEVRHGQQ